MTNKTSVTSEELKATILKRLKEIRDRNIVKNAIEVVRKFHEHGKYKFEEASCYTRESGTFEELCEKGPLKISFHSFGQFHENYKVEIFFGDELVFKVAETHWFPKEEKLVDKTISLKEGSSTYLIVETYKEGEWENFATVEYIKTHRENMKAQKLQDIKKEKEDEETRLFMERAESVMKDLGIELR